jgi:hypothetical protein
MFVRQRGKEPTPKPTGVQSLLRMYRRGVLTDREVTTRVIDLAAEADVAELASQLPTDLLASVRRVLDESPTTEEGWGRMLLIRGGTFTADYDPEAERARWRSSVEALRSYFGRHASDA